MKEPVLLLTALLLAPLAALHAAGAPEQKPSIILLVGDDHGWDETGDNGHPYLKTPVLDEMARSGLRMDRFYAGGASCSPTRATVITGRHHNRSGTFEPGWSLRPEEIGIAQILRKAGYATAHFGKWHLGQSMRTARWRFTRWSDGHTERYDHDADPEELREVSAQHADIIAALTARIQKLPPLHSK